MSDATKSPALFFTSRGSGPDAVSLWTQPVAEIRDGDDPVCARTLGLRVGPGDGMPLLFAEAGGYQMDEATVRALYEQFGAWLDAPRLAARESAEVVAEEDGVRLLKTPHEWGVDRGVGMLWSNDEDTARRRYANDRGRDLCNCGVEVDASPCDACTAAMFAEWLAGDGRCNGHDGWDDDERVFTGSELPPCGWVGKVADAPEVDGARMCPQCGGRIVDVGKT